jgi:hypothetical protein
MKYLRPYLPVILVVLPLIVLVIVRSLSQGSFKPDASKQAKASFTGANLLSREQVAALDHKPFIVKLVPDQERPVNPASDTFFITAGRLLDKENLKAIGNHRGPVLLISGDQAISAKAWMILSQMGYRNLYVLSEKDSSEVFKYKFRPDTAAGI